jgi:hypothetical protein
MRCRSSDGADIAWIAALVEDVKMSKVIGVIGAVGLAALVAACSSANESKTCNGGCLCFTTPQDCPVGCYPAHRKTDSGSVFYCGNGPLPDAGTGCVPVNHRVAGSICPSERGPGTVVAPGCQETSGPVVPGCNQDSDCRSGANGRCQVFGGPACDYFCSYDNCTSDSDCSGNVPCACRASSADATANTCQTASNCRVDTDCGSGGFCSPSLVNNNCQCFSESFCTAADQGSCAETGPDGILKAVPCSCGGNCGHGFFCHTAKDGCLDDSDCGGGLCTFDLNAQAWVCAQGCIGPI